MKFKLDFPIPPFQKKLSIEDSLFLIGSCFAENMDHKLRDYKFDTYCNPNGILFNPMSIANSIHTAILGDFDYSPLIFEHHELWYSWWHHGCFVDSTREQLLKQIIDHNLEAHQRLKSANWLIITWGSAYVYEHIESKLLVANCHKVPTHHFKKRLLETGEIIAQYEELLKFLHRFNPNLKIVFSISPVRYTRDGLHENNLSKATLLLALQTLQTQHKNLMYFPSYEIVVDELRDYRFYEEDWAHPNSLAINYIWEKFVETCFDAKTIAFIHSYDPILKAKQHRPINSQTKAHLKFRAETHKKVMDLQNEYDFLNWKEELDFFAKQ